MARYPFRPRYLLGVDPIELSSHDESRAKRFPKSIAAASVPVTIHTLRNGPRHSAERRHIVQEWLDGEPEAMAAQGGKLLVPVKSVKLNEDGSLTVRFDISSMRGEIVFSVLWISPDRTQADWIN